MIEKSTALQFIDKFYRHAKPSIQVLRVLGTASLIFLLARDHIDILREKDWSFVNLMAQVFIWCSVMAELSVIREELRILGADHVTIAKKINEIPQTGKPAATGSASMSLHDTDRAPSTSGSKKSCTQKKK